MVDGPIKSLLGHKYRPSNGTEGAIFESRWCEKCVRDRAYRESDGNKPGCEILAMTGAYKVDEPGYPSEWVYGAEGPMCTAFDDKEPMTEADKKYLAWKAERERAG